MAQADGLLAVIAGRDQDGLLEVRCRRPSDGRIVAREWFALSQRLACLDFMLAQAGKTDVYIGAAPRIRREGGKSAIRRAWCLWVDCDSPEAVERLAAFKPRPSIIVRSGTGDNVHAYWALSEPLSPAWVERANRRLAYALGGDLKATDAARILRPPGTLNFKTDPPTKVTIARCSVTQLSVASIVGDLPDPPTHKASHRRFPVQTDDPLVGFAAEHYIRVLTGREVDSRNMVNCPFHKSGRETNPSMKAYGTTWYCWGCAKGGSIYELAAILWGCSLPVRGEDFAQVRDRLRGVLHVG